MIFAILSFILVLLGFIFGIVALRKGKEYKFRGMSIAGSVLGIIGGIVPIVIFIIANIVVVSYHTTNVEEQSQEIVSETDSYVGSRPEYTYYTNIDLIRTFTNDQTPASIVVKVVLGYDMNDRLTATELTNRKYEITAFI